MAKLDAKQLQEILDNLYVQVINGIPVVSKSIPEFCEDYTSKYNTPEKAANELIKWQVAKCGTSGFLTGLGGVIVLPAAIPANISSVLYVQMRMIAAIAYIGGFDVNSDQVQTMVYICLCGQSCADLLKQAGIQAGTKITKELINKIPVEVVKKINKIAMQRLVTKAGEKGVINLAKLTPIIGGVIGGAVDVGTTKVIANNAYKVFIANDVIA